MADIRLPDPEKMTGSQKLRHVIARQFDKFVKDLPMFIDAPPLTAIAATGIVLGGAKAAYKGVKFSKGIQKMSKIEKVKQMVIPALKNTEDAERYGEALMKTGNRPAIDQLAKLYEQSSSKVAAMKAAKKPIQDRMDEAVKGQFFREAWENATQSWWGKPDVAWRGKKTLEPMTDVSGGMSVNSFVKSATKAEQPPAPGGQAMLREAFGIASPYFVDKENE